jgi:hypothetical protein
MEEIFIFLKIIKNEKNAYTNKNTNNQFLNWSINFFTLFLQISLKLGSIFKKILFDTKTLYADFIMATYIFLFFFLL